jgi:hypothetical protein
MTLSRGQWVKNPKCPEWGTGQVLQDEGDSVRVLFPIGEKKVSQKYVTLELVDPPCNIPGTAFILVAPPTLNVEKITMLCREFHGEMTDNRPNTDDGGMGIEIIRDFEDEGKLSKRTAERLFAWCHTDRPVYLRGVDLAKRICVEIYGRVPTRDELRALGYFK